MKAQRLTLAEQLAEEIGRRIINGKWAPGNRIDSVSKLANEFGVATATVREAIRILQAQKYVIVRHGSGTYVASPDEQNPSKPWLIQVPEGEDLREVLEARVAVESALVKLAADRATLRQLDIIRESLEEMESLPTDGFAFVEADIRFHERIAEAASNSTLSRIFSDLRAPLRRLIVNVTHSDQGFGALDGPLSAHRRMFDALMTRNSGAAQQALEEINTPGLEYVRSLSPAELASVSKPQE